jgi:hypothetical protein
MIESNLAIALPLLRQAAAPLASTYDLFRMTVNG